jgi:hypothetical protein
MFATNVLYLLLPEILDLLLHQNDLSTIKSVSLVSHTSLNIFRKTTTVSDHIHVLKQFYYLINVNPDHRFSFRYKGFEMHLMCSTLSMFSDNSHIHYSINITPHTILQSKSNHILEISDLYHIAQMMRCHWVFPEKKVFDVNVPICSKGYELVSDAKAWGSTEPFYGNMTVVRGIWNRNGLLTLIMEEADKPLRYLISTSKMELGEPLDRSRGRFQMCKTSLKTNL